MNHKEAAQLLRGDVIKPRAIKAASSEQQRVVDKTLLLGQQQQAEESLVLDNNLFFGSTDLPDLPLNVSPCRQSVYLFTA